MRKETKELKTQFEYVRKTFFPRWDRGRKWRIRMNSNLRLHGLCVWEKQLIQINNGVDCNRILLLIHEIAHAATHSGHTEKFLRRLQAAEKKAVEIGKTELVLLLKKEIEGYKDPISKEMGRAAQIYDFLQEYVLDFIDKKPPTFRSTCTATAKEYGLWDKEFRKKYPRAKKVYEEAKKMLVAYCERNNRRKTLGATERQPR